MELHYCTLSWDLFNLYKTVMKSKTNRLYLMNRPAVKTII